MTEVDLAYVHAAVRAARQPVEEIVAVEVQPLQLGVPVGDDLREEAVLPDVVVEVGAEALRRLLVVLVVAVLQRGEAGDGGGEQPVQLGVQLLPLGLRARRLLLGGEVRGGELVHLPPGQDRRLHDPALRGVEQVGVGGEGVRLLEVRAEELLHVLGVVDEVEDRQVGLGLALGGPVQPGQGLDGGDAGQ